MKSHFSISSGAAMACAVSGATTMLASRCCAQPLIAADYATDSAYAGGWSAGQNGGYGFGPWSMGNTTGSAIQNAIDRTSPYDPFGVAWTIYNPDGPISPAYPAAGQPPGWPGGCPNPPDTGSTGPPTGDVSRVGRAIPNGGLQVGQTFSTIIANPSDRRFYRGYTIRLVTGSENTTYGNAGTQLAVGIFEYFTYGNWYGGLGRGTVSLYDTDTTTNGMQVDVTMTGTNSYHLVMTPLDKPDIAYKEDGTFKTNAPVSWIEYEFYNTDSDFYPSLPACGPDRTDFYIKSMTIGWALNIQRAGANVQVTWPIGTLVEADQVTGPYAANTNISPYTFAPSAAQRFFRLQFQ